MFTDSMTLGEVRAGMRPLVDKGHPCPCCTQLVKVYRRTMTAVATRALIALYLEAGFEYAHMPTVMRKRVADSAGQGGISTLAHNWGLMEPMPGQRDDGSNRMGWWRITDLGHRFVLGQATVPKYARTFNGRCLGLVGEPVTVMDALGKKFNYAELMAGV